MTREDVLRDYKVNEHGRIVSPGKFEGEMLYAPYFYDAMLNGMADETGDSETGEPDVFTVTDEDRAQFPELADAVRIELYEDINGFVYLLEDCKS